jgi:hypothetical protein
MGRSSQDKKMRRQYTSGLERRDVDEEEEFLYSLGLSDSDLAIIRLEKESRKRWRE